MFNDININLLPAQAEFPIDRSDATSTVKPGVTLMFHVLDDALRHEPLMPQISTDLSLYKCPIDIPQDVSLKDILQNTPSPQTGTDAPAVAIDPPSVEADLSAYSAESIGLPTGQSLSEALQQGLHELRRRDDLQNRLTPFDKPQTGGFPININEGAGTSNNKFQDFNFTNRE